MNIIIIIFVLYIENTALTLIYITYLEWWYREIKFSYLN